MLLRFSIFGPFTSVLSVQSPLNSESLIGLSFLLLLMLRNMPKLVSIELRAEKSHLIPLVCVVVVTTLPFLVTINAPLLHDSYTHVAEAASNMGARSRIVAMFMHPSGSDRFFRPFGYLGYWIEFQLVGQSPLGWHICNLLMHLLNSGLTYALAIQLSFTRFSASVAALVFGIHGSRPEAVSWAAAQFDLLAALFTLLSLIFIFKYLTERQRLWFVPVFGCTLVALLSKEAAYCLPIFVVGLLPFVRQEDRNSILKIAGVQLAFCTLVFVCRFYLLGGLGGYRTTSGESTIARFNLIRTIKALGYREWSFLFFPINWSVGPKVWLQIFILIMIVVMVGFLACAKMRPHLLLASILLVVVADLPVEHLLLLGMDLSGARVLYLPVLGLALFWGLVVQGCSERKRRLSLTAGLLAFQLTVLLHNLGIWRQAAFLSQRTCRAVGAELARDPRSIVVRGLPNILHGVYFLRNGILPCVEMNSDQDASRIFADQQPTVRPVRNFFWNETRERLEERSERPK